MDILELIRRKHAGLRLTDDEIHDFVAGVSSGHIADYQLTALLMAICYEGLNDRECSALTQAYVASGDRLDWSALPGKVVDKHSTGGVGDKVSPVLVPWIAALGYYIPKLSGRGLGHTGGTIDKLESIPNFRVELARSEQMEIVSRLGCMNVASTANLVPADRRIYALRNSTDTVKEAGLIAASVMSKKIAAGADFLVLDVKCGNGAFFDDEKKALQLAELARSIGHAAGRAVGCVISDMNQPLGFAVGNALELRESIALMESGEGPADLLELCLTMGSCLMRVTGDEVDDQAARTRMLDLLTGGQVYERFEEWISAQGGDLRAFTARLAQLVDYRHVYVTATEPGYIAGFDTAGLGEFARSLGAGRTTLTDEIDPLVGFVLERKIGAKVAQGDVIAEIIAAPRESRSAAELAEQFVKLVKITPTEAQPPRLIKAVLV